MTIRHSTIHRDHTILMFDDESSNDKKPMSSMQLMQMGDHGMVHSLMGPGFYQMVQQDGFTPFTDLGIVKVYAAVSDQHLELMRRKLTKRLDITREGINNINNMPFNWISLKEHNK